MKKILATVAIMAASFTSYAQVGIGTTNPQGILDLVSADNGLILPRVATTAAVLIPVDGMIVYDISENCFKGYQNNTWAECGLMPDATAAATLAAAASNTVLAQIGNEADAAGTVPSVVTVAQLATILPALIGLDTGNEAAYQAYIDAMPGMFAAPATAAQVQAMVYAVNVAEAPTSTDVLTQIGNEADAPDTVVSVVTVAELNSISPTITNLLVGNEAQYQAYIDLNPTLFAAPATAAQVQAMVTAVNAAQGQATLDAASNAVLVQIGNEADTGDTVASVVTVAQLAAILPKLNGIYAMNEALYQAYIDANPGIFSAPATSGQVQAMLYSANRMGNTSPGEVVGAGGLIWKDRNLGATQVATSTDDSAAYGDYYQWGRRADGHQRSSSSSTSTKSNTPTSSNNQFILDTTAPYSWYASAVNLDLWIGVSGGKSNIDPCPNGFKIPTSDELFDELRHFTTIADALTSPLRLPLSGFRSGQVGTFTRSDVELWSNESWLSGSGQVGRFVRVGTSSGTSRSNAFTVAGLPIRCIKIAL